MSDTHNMVVSTTDKDNNGDNLEDRVYMPDHLKERCELAKVYAEDGAYHSAARVLQDLADEVKAHAENVYGRAPE